MRESGESERVTLGEWCHLKAVGVCPGSGGRRPCICQGPQSAHGLTFARGAQPEDLSMGAEKEHGWINPRIEFPLAGVAEELKVKTWSAINYKASSVSGNCGEGQRWQLRALHHKDHWSAQGTPPGGVHLFPFYPKNEISFIPYLLLRWWSSFKKLSSV